MYLRRRHGVSRVVEIAVFLTLAILTMVVGAQMLGFLKIKLIDLSAWFSIDKLLGGLG